MEILDGVELPSKGSILSEKEAMELALRVARGGYGRVSPNPLVGCVILDPDSALISWGYHKVLGGSHAEVDALEGLTDSDLKGAQVIVTLEPCSHEGLTPSCAKKLATLPISKVIYGLVDPNPKVSGRGIKILESAGIVCQQAEFLHTELEELAEIFLVNHRNKRPFVSLKVATSLDGRFATSSGVSQWITGEAARKRSHFLRAGHDAILVGVNTILNDDPSLNIRFEGFEDLHPFVIVLDPHLKLLKQSPKIFSLHKKEKLILVHCQEESGEHEEESPVTLLKVGKKEDSQMIDLNEMLSKLFAMRVFSVFVEGGGVTHSHFLQEDLVDRLHLFLAPLVVGSGKTWTDSFHQGRPLEERFEIQGLSAEALGPDLYLTGTRNREAAHFLSGGESTC